MRRALVSVRHQNSIIHSLRPVIWLLRLYAEQCAARAYCHRALRHRCVPHYVHALESVRTDTIVRGVRDSPRLSSHVCERLLARKCAGA